MAEWTFYAARGILNKDNKFDSAQIEEGLKAGLMPQVILTPSASKDIINNFCCYLKNKDLEGISLKVTTHGTEDSFFDSKTPSVKELIDVLSEINNAYGEQVINEMVIHAGALHTFIEDCELRQRPEYSEYNLLDATFTIKEYEERLEEIKELILEGYNYADERGIKLIIENLGQINFAVVPSMRYEDKPEELKSDSRDGDTIWLHDQLQLGDIGCVYDLDYLTCGKFPVCIDIEHLSQSVEYSQDYNLENIEVENITDYEIEILDRFGVFVRKGHPVLFEKPIDPVEFISTFKGRIPICHIGGQVDMFYYDGRMKKSGAHMLVTFGDDLNEYIEDDNLRLDQNLRRQERIETYLRALHDAGCRQGVFEFKVGDYVGEKWRKYHEISLKNVKLITDCF